MHRTKEPSTVRSVVGAGVFVAGSKEKVSPPSGVALPWGCKMLPLARRSGVAAEVLGEHINLASTLKYIAHTYIASKFGEYPEVHRTSSYAKGRAHCDGHESCSL